MNLLLVDDEPLALQDLEDAVRAALPRADIHSFGKAREALAYGRENPVDIAF